MVLSKSLCRYTSTRCEPGLAWKSLEKVRLLNHLPRAIGSESVLGSTLKCAVLVIWDLSFTMRGRRADGKGPWMFVHAKPNNVRPPVHASHNLQMIHPFAAQMGAHLSRRWRYDSHGKRRRAEAWLWYCNSQTEEEQPAFHGPSEGQMALVCLRSEMLVCMISRDRAVTS